MHVWGNPTPETQASLPKTLTVTIHGDAGRRLRALMAKGPILHPYRRNDQREPTDDTKRSRKGEQQ